MGRQEHIPQQLTDRPRLPAGTDTQAFGVIVPDLPGCFSAGDTVEEAFDNAPEAIEAYCEVAAGNTRTVPIPAICLPRRLHDGRARQPVMTDATGSRFESSAE